MQSWHELIPTFVHEFNDLTSANSFCLFGVNDAREVVVCHAARFFEWTNTSFAEEACNLRLFYAHPERMKHANEQCIVTAQSAQAIRGRVVYSGAAWVRPDYRKRSLSSVFPRLGKALAYVSWSPDFIVSLMTEENWRRGLAGRTGYATVDWSIDVRNSRMGTRRFALVVMRRQCILEYASALIPEQPIDATG